jgi:RNA polymerase sigma-70 factor (ECF subfamily)
MLVSRDNPIELDDATLLGAIARGDGAAFESLVRRHSTWCMRFLCRILGQREVAEDVLQSCLVQLWERPPAWQPNAQFRTWLYRVLHNRCIDHFRRNPNYVNAPFFSDTENDSELAPYDSTHGPTDSSSEQGAIQRLDIQSALQTLPERQRIAVVLVYFEERSQTEAAALMDVSVGALESLLSRARATLSKQLAAHRN